MKVCLMTKYRDLLIERYDADIGSVVGCGLDRLDRDVSEGEISRAVSHYQANKEQISKLVIGARRDLIYRLISGR